MANAVVAYDRELPEIPGRRPWERPDSYLVKDADVPGGWRVEASGRRPSGLLLVEALRVAVDRWRADWYPGASDVTRRLFDYWFEEEHEVPGFPVPFRYHFCQREAIETLAYVVEVFGERDVKPLIERFGRIDPTDLLTKSVEFQTTTDGRRQIRRFVAEREAVGVQDLPPQDLRRFAFKMATGSGKTWVMAMAIVWSYFHKKRIAGSDLSTSFLVVAPNVIVYQRLEKDFGDGQVFTGLPLIPPEWKGAWGLKVIRRGESTEPDPSGNLFVTNIQQIYESRRDQWTPANAVEALLGRKPAADLAGGRSVLERVRELKDLVVINDEAHHVHDEDLAWSQALLGVHQALPGGLALWLDMSATPKDQQGMYYPWTLCDYPLAQAVEDRIVKAPLIVTREGDPERPRKEPERITRDNVADKYHYWIDAAVRRWKVHRKTYAPLGHKPVLFIMVEKTVFAEAIGEHLRKTKGFGFKKGEVLVIHTDTKGEITKAHLETARKAARDVDEPESPIKAIVSVMMLREGWDVRNVTVVLGLRPFTATAEILPEQVIGRGLRLMPDIGPDRTQTLEVLGTPKLLEFLRHQLESEGVGVGVAKSDPPRPVTVYPVQERQAYDVAIPITKPQLVHVVARLSELDPARWGPIYDQAELGEVFRVSLRLEFATTETEVHQEYLAAAGVPMAQELIGSITAKTMERARLPNVFAELYPVVRDYVATRCFGKVVDLDAEATRSHLRRPEIQEGIAKYLAREIARVTVERKTLEFENAAFTLSGTRPFTWRRDLPPLECKRTVFNYVATYNKFERRFAQFLDAARDVQRFASLATTEQGSSGTPFRVDYLKPSGAIGFYYPDWAVVQKTPEGEVNWIIETKGRVWEDTEDKDAAVRDWCARVSRRTSQRWRFARVNQAAFDAGAPRLLADAVANGHPELPAADERKREKLRKVLEETNRKYGRMLQRLAD